MDQKNKPFNTTTYDRRKKQFEDLKSKYCWWVYDYFKGELSGMKNKERGKNEKDRS